MKLSVLSILASAFALAGAEPLGDSDADNSASKGTVFNSKPVPPLLELTPANWNDEVNKTKWLLVKNFRYQAVLFYYPMFFVFHKC